ncbi:MAG: hypothetical protein FD141_1010 [Fusobacteria bacterium]|nr:MAG: hypothetical protein FD141_1010 [Fusobacteriota bacterium]KAF0229723.1 MAG: hypothetical protein FD182_113 [Fusobacteriota bacterium]
MDFVLRINEQIGEVISSNIRGIWGLVIHGLLLFVFVGLLGYIVFWVTKLLLVSLVWLAPAIVIVLVVLIIAYMLSKVSGLYK